MRKLWLFMLLPFTISTFAIPHYELKPTASLGEECVARADAVYALAKMRDDGKTKGEVEQFVMTNYRDTRTGELSAEQQNQFFDIITFVFSNEASVYRAKSLREGILEKCEQMRAEN